MNVKCIRLIRKGGKDMARHKSKKKMNVDIGELSMTLVKANVIGYALTAIFIILAALLLTYTNLGPAFEKTVILMGVMVSAALVGYDTAKMENKNGYKWGMIGGCSYLVIYIILAVAMNGLATIQVSSLLVLAVLTLVSGALAGMFCVASQK